MSLFEDCLGLPKRHRDLSPCPIYEPVKYDPPQWPWPPPTSVMTPPESKPLSAIERVPAMRADEV